MRKHLHIDLLSLSWLLILLSISNCLTPGLRCALCALPKTCFLVCLFVFLPIFPPKSPYFANFSWHGFPIFLIQTPHLRSYSKKTTTIEGENQNLCMLRVHQFPNVNCSSGEKFVPKDLIFSIRTRKTPLFEDLFQKDPHLF